MELWMPGVEKIESDAYYKNPEWFKPVGVINHIMQGYQRTMIAWAKERPHTTEVSAHFTIGKNGRIIQHVPMNCAARHAGRLDVQKNPVWPLWKPGQNPSLYAYGIEHEGLTGEVWTSDQVHASIRVHKFIFSQHPSWTPNTETIIPHAQTSPISRAHDPGTGWWGVNGRSTSPGAGSVWARTIEEVAKAATPPMTGHDLSTPRDISLFFSRAGLAVYMPNHYNKLRFIRKEKGSKVYELRVEDW